MPNKNAIKGKNFERDLVRKLNALSSKFSRHYLCERTWGSNGKSMGLNEEVDLRLIQAYGLGTDPPDYTHKFNIQCKNLKKLPKTIKDWLVNVDMAIVKDDCRTKDGGMYVVMPFEVFERFL